MKVSLNWLNEFVEIPADARSLKTGLTRIGLNVESLRALGDDFVFEIEVTTNRPDCLSHYGVAREVSTLYNQPLKPIQVQLTESSARAADRVSIEIADPELCARYCGRVIENVQIKSSPDWLSNRLEAVGMRPINNVADVTNYVLMELGHPLHAFDFARLQGRKIIVRRAKPGEALRTLDGLDRALKSDNLVIADAERPVALAGIMGGGDSEISSATRSVLLESAWFDAASIRRTAKSFGMHTEASHRFERGADIEMAPLALDRAAALIAELAGGEVLRGVVDVYPAPRQRDDAILRPSEIRRVLGTYIPEEEIERILGSLGFQFKEGKRAGWLVVPPSFRLDVSREVDLIEELARHHGYDLLPARARSAPPRRERDDRREKELAVSTILLSLGYREIIPPSMVDPEENARFTDRPPVPLTNPLSQEASAMRSTPIPSMIRALRWNLDRDQGDLRFFELGKTYSRSRTFAKGLPEERRVLTLGLSGHRRPPSVHESEEEKEKLLVFFDLKGDLETLLAAFEIAELGFESNGHPYHQRGSAGRFTAQGEPLALFGRLSNEIAREYKLRETVWLAELDFERLIHLPLRQRAFHPYSSFPAVERDFSLLVPESVTYSMLESEIRALGFEEIQSFGPVDFLPAGKIAAEYYSLLLRVRFQSQSRTLTGDEVSKAGGKLLAVLKPLGVRLRG